jgi:hypothetical protein
MFWLFDNCTWITDILLYKSSFLYYNFSLELIDKLLLLTSPSRSLWFGVGHCNSILSIRKLGLLLEASKFRPILPFHNRTYMQLSNLFVRSFSLSALFIQLYWVLASQICPDYPPHLKSILPEGYIMLISECFSIIYCICENLIIQFRVHKTGSCF